jgi:hypothetical protein
MLPNVYGFNWTPLHVAFLGIFFTVALIIAIVVAISAWRARRDLRSGTAEAIRWHGEFEDLPARDRGCRHEFTGEFPGRKCDRAFDCRTCATHGRLLTERPQQPSGEDETLCGLSYPGDRYYHRGHTWAKPHADGTFTIGFDELSRRMFGRFEQLELPALGTRLSANGAAWIIRQNGDEFRVLSPLDGEVVEQGGPDEDFFLRIRATGGDLQTRHLLAGAEIRPWVMRELERLQILISPDPNQPTLADGGVLVDDAPAMFPDVNWPAVWGEMLLEP